MEPTYRIEIVVPVDGKLILERLPFTAGDQVEVTVQPVRSKTAVTDRYPLRGKVLRYDQPTDPVAASDWEAAS